MEKLNKTMNLLGGGADQYMGSVSRTADQQRIGARIQKASFQGDDMPSPKRHHYLDGKIKDSKEVLSGEESEAIVSNKINERFKSLNVRTFKNNSLTNAASVSNRNNKRRNLGGMRQLQELGGMPQTTTNKLLGRNFSP